jgi:5-methylcytosine-specific restriction enzyme subunit McrC
VRRQALICRRDDLEVNVLQNQILRATLHLLANDQGIDELRRVEAARLERLLHLVDVIPLSQGVFRRVQLHRNNAGYRFLLNVCELIWLGLLPDPEALRHRGMFDEIRNDDRIMRRIFEEFIGNFYCLEMPSLDVAMQKTLKWDADPRSDLKYLPLMRADAVLRSRRTGRTLVADAKYYPETLVSFHDRERVRSAHLYQITAYLRSTELKSTDTEGLLIYPQSGPPVSATFFLSGRRVRVRTVDLSADWREIHAFLCGLVAHID